MQHQTQCTVHQTVTLLRQGTGYETITQSNLFAHSVIKMIFFYQQFAFYRMSPFLLETISFRLATRFVRG